MQPLHVISILYYYDPDLETPEQLLKRYSTIRPMALALRKEGAKVTTLMRFHRDSILEEDGTQFSFHSDLCSPRLRKWQIPWSLHSAVRKAFKKGDRSTVVHVHGLLYPMQIRALRAVLGPGCAIVAQDHANRPWPTPIRPLQKWGMTAADGFFFAARTMASSWVDDGIIARKKKIFEVMEGSNDFRRGNRVTARARTGLSGDPVILWVGRLIPLKDPLTVLEGFERVLQHAPGARLYMLYQVEDLLPALRARIARNPRLQETVTLMGQRPHSALEDLYNSADYFVLGSHREGSSFSLAEALACGVIPVVTDIPSFRAMTDAGRVGRCWSVGNPSAFADALLDVMHQPIELLSARAAQFFNQELSYSAIARKSFQAYHDVITVKTNSRA